MDYASAEGMYVMINVHWDGGDHNKGWLENSITDVVDPTIDAKMHSYWTQIATAFAGYDNHLLFAAANEPNVHNPAEWETLKVYYKTFIDAVRDVARVMPTAGWYYKALSWPGSMACQPIQCPIA